MQRSNNFLKSNVLDMPSRLYLTSFKIESIFPSWSYQRLSAKPAKNMPVSKLMLNWPKK